MNPDKEELVRKSGKPPHYAPVRRREEEALFNSGQSSRIARGHALSSFKPGDRTDEVCH
jgi:hypothetical protein